MIFGNVILGDDQMSVPNSASHIGDITSCTISNAYFDDFYVTKDIESELGNVIPQIWDENTILDGRYDDDTQLTAGDINMTLDDIKGNTILIKRRIADNSSKWITLHAYTIDSERTSEEIYASLNHTFLDYTCLPGTEYQYAIVIVTKDDTTGEKTESDYYIVDVTPDVSRLSISSGDGESWSTILTDGFCNNQRNTAPGVINTLNDKYPTIVDNSVANYETVTVTAEFYPVDDKGCLILPDDPDDMRAAMKEIKKFKDFLMNRKAKILKNIDGRMWFCYVTTPPSDNAKDVYYFREISFGVTEIADIEDQEELYNSGFITASGEWWST